MPARRELPDVVSVGWRRLYDLRYGENPHQKAAFYADASSPLARGEPGRPTVAGAEVLGGKQLSYNNILDLDAALGLCLELDAPSAVVIKHNNPCGVASAGSVAAAYLRAREADPVSAFGGIVAVNREVDDELARLLVETFLECVIAPGYSEAAREHPRRQEEPAAVRGGGRLVAARRHRDLDGADDRRRRADPDRGQRDGRGRGGDGGDQEGADRRRARRPRLRVAGGQARQVERDRLRQGPDHVGIGAGQMSRVDSVKIAELKAKTPIAGSVVASDAFFPFRDGVDVLARAGATAVIQPGGSVRDEEVIAAADEHGLAMVFTGMRHFRH